MGKDKLKPLPRILPKKTDINKNALSETVKPHVGIQGETQKPRVPAMGSLSSSITMPNPETLVFGVCMKQEPHPTVEVARLEAAAMP